MREQSSKSRAAVDDYVERMRNALRGSVSEGQLRDIVEETRSHLLDRLDRGSAAEVGEALRGLGPPEQYAQRFLDDGADQKPGRAPALVRLVGQGAAGFIVLNVAAVLYAIALVLFLTAIAKAVSPDSVGLWLDAAERSWSFWYGSSGETPPPGREVLGFWLVPIGLVGALAVYGATTFVVRRWLRRRERTSPST